MKRNYPIVRIATLLCCVFFLALEIQAFNCTGEGTCLIETEDGELLECLSELELETDTDYSGGLVEVDIITYKSLTSDCFEATLQDSPENQSTITVNSDDGCSAFPATVSVRVFMVVTYGGSEYYSNNPVCLRSTSSVNSWPPEDGDATEYEVQNNVTFVSEETGQSFSILAGSSLNVSTN